MKRLTLLILLVLTIVGCAPILSAVENPDGAQLLLETTTDGGIVTFASGDSVAESVVVFIGGEGLDCAQVSYCEVFQRGLLLRPGDVTVEKPMIAVLRGRDFSGNATFYRSQETGTRRIFLRKAPP